MITKEEIRKVAESKIKELEGFFVDIRLSQANVITLFFDRHEGVEVEHCLLISKHIEEHFDREIEDYELTVCSAGLDNPFVVEQQYHKNNGKEVGVLLISGKREKGVILSYQNDVLTLETVRNKKENTTSKVIIPKSEIKETKLKINFK
jgi:ribosome maturation factor RimP